MSKGDDESIDPASSMWLALTITRMDGTLGNAAADDDYNSEGMEGIFATEKQAIDYLKDQADTHGSVGYVYACTPTRKVSRIQRVRVESITAKC